ncbi:hypothetical protein ACEZCY_28355 [Streptacidiphilus sp. N1-12]|uniref:DUF3885 domain-containing protein n=2 Tax=Streptacidiphilus alkalitolerans TaxID=3342712 RepID=A0ABV6VGR4_9ACTN
MPPEGPSGLLHRWAAQWSPCPPIGHELHVIHPDRWVRFHSLPGSKRYAEDDAEYATLLDRHNTVINELFAGEDVYVFTADWSETDTPNPEGELSRRLSPGSEPWTTILTADDPDPEFRVYTHLRVRRTPWRIGSLDPLLRSVADYESAGVIIADTALKQLYHPYDGGADALLASTTDRDALRERHRDWLSTHPSGL